LPYAMRMTASSSSSTTTAAPCNSPRS
jgi:hypothetical protein